MSIKQFPGGIITQNPTAPSGPYETSTAPGIWTLDQVANYKKQGIWPTAGNVAPPTTIGQSYGGGYYAGQIGVSGVATHYLIVGPAASAQWSGLGPVNGKPWKTTNTSTAGTSSIIDGPTNSSNMNNASHPAAYFCEGLTIGGYSDWYMPATNEVEVCYFNLKPTTNANNTGYGINANAVPARASNYTGGTPATNPAQTSATIFQTGNSEAFQAQYYWSSTEISATNATYFFFNSGTQGGYMKTGVYFFVRAIRRIAV